ncbi:right-handed parallel beta-helix repeat-containing protein [Geodermatophilus sp. DSM 44513]|uniref:right-handed parallel beta-helix repeat-containing protein n=1 Tax=Geodermatophilus sp. DSM 44513 TaxID=1528104 RepID=UPI001413587F|nr:right-handed parallel beta-helix repeat-containing protein [Geodermatophilus sp. DSM 44513]WNV76005.1 right-handed parallel beta-helix repeat-containing protein [Geodermatophilus sp. DSM 44513]
MPEPSIDVDDFPTEESTGVPTATQLRRHAGDIVVDEDGTLIEALDIDGCVIIRAHDVTIRASRISCAGSEASPFPIRMMDGYSNLKIVDSEIDGLGKAPVALYGNNWTADRIDVHNSADGVRLGDNTTLRESYVHDLAPQPGLHSDAVQVLHGRNVTVQGNTLMAYNPTLDDPLNGAIQTGQLMGPLDDVLIEGNYMDGGSYTVRGGAVPRDRHHIGVYVFRDNVIGPNCGYGPVDGVGAPVRWDSSNVWLDTAQVIPADGRSVDSRCTKEHRSRALAE